ncbi:MAG: NitT/TauT family transport system ATP-binding protein [Thermotogaceae bacterium]|nr:NitT/TauT family transport system ATP-binding protein [Thermotogaceae bacterium]MDN5337638.1 NitT/TauT family transport system ATP-binding protein [Thermotogaceae bacterium]
MKNIGFNVKSGETVVLCGQSGCGKTTLLNIISGIEIPTSGKVKLKTEKIAYVFQDDRLIPWKNVIQNILFVMRVPDISKARRILKIVGIEKFEKTKPSKLSGGMKKRLNFARALASEPELILMDEPFSSVDLKTKFSLIEFLKELLKNEIKSALIVTHDPEEAAILGDKIIIIGGNPSTVKETVTPDVDKFNRKIDYIQNLTIKIKHLLQVL